MSEQQMQMEIITQTDRPLPATIGFAAAKVSGDPVFSTWQLEAIWSEVIIHWLNDEKRPNTQRNYLNALADFLTKGGDRFSYIKDVRERIASCLRESRLQPWLVSKNDVHAWKMDLEARQVRSGSNRIGQPLSASNIALMLAGVASFYKFACNYSFVLPDGREYQVYQYRNPCEGIRRPKTTGHKAFKRAYMTADQVRRFLNAIPKDTLNGKMHFAMMLFYLRTGRRNSEVRLLQWQHFDVQPDGRIIYTWHGKHHVEGEEYELPEECWVALEDYLCADGRWGKMQPTDYLFTAHSNNAARFRHVGDFEPGTTPLDSHEPVRIVKVYARAAGLDASKLGVHSLRHTVGHGLKAAGARIEEIKDALGHANINTTMIYEREDEHPVSEASRTMADMFGVNSVMKRRQASIAKQSPQ